MSFNITTVIIFVVLTLLKISNGTKTSEFITVSTTVPPNEKRECQLCQTVGEHNYRLSLIESQVAQNQKLVEEERKVNEKLRKDVETKNKQIVDMQTKLDKQHRLTQELKEKLEGQFFQAPNDTSQGTNFGFFSKNCKEVKDSGNHLSGTYFIRPKSKTFKVLCDMGIRDGGWTVFQKRFDGSQDFYLNWNDYKNGFGDFSGEFWLGLEHLYDLTGDDYNELLIELTDSDNKTVYAHYYSFGITNEKEGYALKVLEGYDGDAGNSFAKTGMKFTTKDRDQDEHKTAQCAVRYTGAWWYYQCLYSNLNGRYLELPVTGNDVHSGIVWGTFHGGAYSLRRTRMMVRPR